LRKSVENKQAEMVVSEGGLKTGAWYLERIKSASREHLNGTMGAVDENGKWQEIQNFTRVEKLRIMSDREAFQEFAVLGTWDSSKRGNLLNQFLPPEETVDDNDISQLMRILTNAQIVLTIAHGSPWRDIFTPIIQRMENGTIGRAHTAQIKSVVEETWDSCNLSLQDDSATTSLSVGGIPKHFNVDNLEEVISMFKTRFSSIQETTWILAAEVNTSQEKKKNELLETAKVMGKKRDKSDNSDECPPYKKQPVIGGKTVQYSTSSKGNYQTNQSQSKGKGANLPTRPSTQASPSSWLCLWNLKYQLLNTTDDCKKVGNCGREHYDRSKKGTPGYQWTLATVTKQVEKASALVVSAAEKKKLLDAVKKEF
jgi:hypothetical protein